MTDISVSLRGKRKRGRPRKDSILPSTLPSPETSTLTPIETTPKESNVDSMVGTIVYGVIEGSFDAGYLISVKIGNNHTPFRGVVFQTTKFVPLTASNDVAPQVKMHHRKEMSVPAYDNVNQTTTTTSFTPQSQVGLQPVQASKQAVLRPVLQPSVGLSPYSSNHQSSYVAPDTTMVRTSSCSNMGGTITAPKSPNSGVCKQFSYVHPTGSLRMVEEDEVMQAFEVSTPSKNNDQAHGKAAGLGPNVDTIGPSAFEIQQDDMMCREMDQPNRLQSPTTGPQEIPGENTEQQQPMSNQYYNVDFPQNLFTGPFQPNQEPKSLAQFNPGDFYDSVSKSPNLKLDLAYSVHENKSLGSNLGPNYSMMRNPNLSYHQALVAGNPLLLPLDLPGEPLDFVMEKPKSPQNCKTSLESGERFPGETAVSSSTSYKLELATPQAALNTGPEMQTNSSAGCITDMDYVLSDAIRPAESHHHESGPSETEHRLHFTDQNDNGE